MYFCPCYWSFIAETKVAKRAEIQERILALNFYIWKWFTGQQYSITECFAATSTFAQYIFGKFFKAQLWENVHNMKKLHRKKWFSRFQLLPLPCQIFAYLLCLQHQDRWNFWHIQVFWELCFSDTWSSHKNLCCGIKVSIKSLIVF